MVGAGHLGLLEAIRQRLRGGRLYHLTVLLALLLLGLCRDSTGVDKMPTLLILGTALLTQMAWTTPGQRYEWKGALATGAILSLLLQAEELWVGGFAAFLAVSSKFVFRRVPNRVWMNPSLVGMAAVVLLGEAQVAKGLWGADLFVGLGLMLTVGLLLFRPGAAMAVVPFFFWFVVLQIGAVAWFDGSAAAATQKLPSVTLLLFAFFVVGDMKALPAALIGRFLFAMSAAALAVAIGAWAAPGLAMVVSLLVASHAVPLLDRVYPAAPSQWPRMRIDRAPV